MRIGPVFCWSVILGWATTVSGQAPSNGGSPLEIGRSYTLESRVLGESRVIDVALPAGYGSTPDRRYPVLFVLDGEFEAPIAMSIARFYAEVAELPPLIVVGIRNTDRTRDYTPVPVAGFERPPEAGSAGGADRYLEFLAAELIPYVDRSYRAAPMRVLVGHSLGGLLALYALAARPDLFQGYVVMEPSTWWNGGRELDEARATLGRPAARRARVVTVNSLPLGLDTTAWGGDRPMVRELSVTGETHASMAMAGMMLALKTLFADFKPAQWRPGSRPIAMLDRYDSLAARVGYAAPIPSSAFQTVARMSIDSRYFDDAARVLDRMERTLGPSDASRALRTRLERERTGPAPAGFVPLEFPSRRPTPRDAEAFLGRWVSIDADRPHDIDIEASGDTILVRDRIAFPSGDPYDAFDPVIQVTSDGVLEWGLPWFRGLAALLVLRGRLEADGTMTVTREPRGWVPRGPGADLTRVTRFRRRSSSSPKSPRVKGFGYN